MVTDISRFVRNDFKALEPTEILTKSVDCLLGVSPLAKQAIAKLGIVTVFDLASSKIFATAGEILAGANGASTGLARYGQVPGELLDSNKALTKLTDLPVQSIEVLRQVSPSLRASLEHALDVKTIRDFSLWPPYHAAQAILSHTYGQDLLAEDPEATDDLVPANGQYPTERVHYEVLLFDEYVNHQSSETSAEEASNGEKSFKPLNTPLDVSELLAGIEGYRRPAVGGVLTFTQSWYTKGLALGNLIHAVALAPGESTRIALIDWSRKTGTSVTEDISETEALDSSVARSRGISEITSAVAKETQEGRSAAHSNAESSQFGKATGSAAFLTSLVSLPGVNTSGTSFGTSSGSSDASSWSTSSGQRDLAAKLNQDIVDRTQQASHSARNRRASIVREVSQVESEKISTRTLTNYNHMHALTVEYYEVVQLYRTVVELAGADRCLFVPMKLIDFRNVSMIDRHRGLLAAAALVPAVREGLQYPTGTTRINAPAVTRVKTTSTPTVGPPSPLDDLSPDSWTPMDIVQARVATGGVANVQPDGRLVLPSDAVVYKIDFVANDKMTQPDTLTLTKLDGTSASTTYQEEGGWDLSDKRLRIDELASVTMTASGITGSGKTGFLSIIFKLGSTSFRISFPVKLEANTIMPALYAATVPVDLISHFQDNRLYYSQAIWRGLDPATIGILLSGYTWPVAGHQRPLVEIVDPTPVAIVANYLVLRLSGDDDVEREAWLSRKKITVGRAREDLVPVPSGGVFAEAVLGRSNSAEKLDITRFWNWQDSPIPVLAPDIAPIQSGSRRDIDNTTPGQLGAPVLNIVNPPSLPDPQGMGAILAAIQNGNMFRDMSGLAATIGLAQAGLAGAQQGASDASAQAGKNAAVAAELGAKVAEVAGKVIATYLTGGASLAGGAAAGMAGGISGQGAKINHGRDMDRRQVVRPHAQSTFPSTTGPTQRADEIISSDTPMGDASEASSVGTWEGDAANTSLGGGPSFGGGGPSSVAGVVPYLLMGASPTGATNSGTADLSQTRSKLAIVEKLVATDSTKLGACSKKYIENMRNIVDASKLLGPSIVAGTIISWIPKDFEDIVVSPAHTAEHIGEVVEALGAIPVIIKGRLKLVAELASLTCKNLTTEEVNYWDNMIRLLA